MVVVKLKFQFYYIMIFACTFLIITDCALAELVESTIQGVVSQDSSTGGGMVLLLPSGIKPIESARCKGKIGSDNIECKVYGRLISNMNTDYFTFVGAGWRLLQIVPDNDSKYWFYFFQR